MVHDHGQARIGERGDHPVHPIDEPVAELAGHDPERRVRARLGGDVAEHLSPERQVEVCLRQCEHDGVDADAQPGALEPCLQGAAERRLAGARGAIEDDDASTGRHAAMMT